MIFKRLSISIDSRDFWTANDPDIQERFVRAIERGVNHPKHIKMAEHLIPDDLQDMLENVPVMLISMVVDDAVHQFADFSYHLRDSDYEIGAMFACHTDPDLCGIVIPVERLHDPFHLRHSIEHELVHYNQWRRGDLQTDPEHQGLLWKGKLYTNEYMAKSHGMSFADGLKWQIENLPWEEEAYGSCDQMINAGRDERDLYYWLCDRYRQEPEDYDKYWSKKDNYKNYLSALMDLGEKENLMSKKGRLEDQQAERLDLLAGVGSRLKNDERACLDVLDDILTSRHTFLDNVPTLIASRVTIGKYLRRNEVLINGCSFMLEPYEMSSYILECIGEGAVPLGVEVRREYRNLPWTVLHRDMEEDGYHISSMLEETPVDYGNVDVRALCECKPTSQELHSYAQAIFGEDSTEFENALDRYTHAIVTRFPDRAPLPNTGILQQLNDKVRELTKLLTEDATPDEIAVVQKEVDVLNAKIQSTLNDADIVARLGDEPLFEEGEIEAIANKAIAEVHAEERYNRKIDEQTAIRMGALTLAEVDRMAYDAAGFSSPSYDTALLAGEMAPHPVQPVYEDENGTVRFKPNPIIRDLQEAGVLDLNKIAGKYDKKDISQLNQLIGYSVDGWWYLSTTSQMDKIKAAMQEERRKAFDSIDGEINYLRKKDDITPIDAIHVTMEAEQYPLPIELPILFQRMTKFDGHYSLSVNSKDSWEVEWVDSSFHGHCSYNLTPDSPDGTPEFPVGTINLKVNENHLWLEKIGEPDSGQAILTFNWPQVTEQLSRGKCELPTVVNFGISKLLTNYGTFTKASADFQGIYQMCQAVLRFMASRKFILDNLTPELFEPELYAKLFKAASYGPVKDNTAVNKLLKATQRAGVRGQIQTAFKHIANSEILFEDSKIHLETDRAVYDAHTTELEELIKQYL